MGVTPLWDGDPQRKGESGDDYDIRRERYRKDIVKRCWQSLADGWASLAEKTNSITGQAIALKYGAETIATIHEVAPETAANIAKSLSGMIPPEKEHNGHD